ncbi:MAG TPA: cytochrome c [Sphingomonadaceae bacterium]|nr:cytochrome c [Sphingomonadaceae bacterium]
MKAPLRALAGCLVAAGAIAAGPAAEPQAADGNALFVDNCGGCHLEGGFGTRVLSRRVAEGEALLERRSYLPTEFTKAVVRQGIGSMPQIREAELSDEQLDLIARYLDRKQ